MVAKLSARGHGTLLRVVPRVIGTSVLLLFFKKEVIFQFDSVVRPRKKLQDRKQKVFTKLVEASQSLLPRRRRVPARTEGGT